MVFLCTCGFSCGTQKAFDRHLARFAEPIRQKHKVVTEDEDAKTKQSVVLAFNRFDLDGNGRITLRELQTVMVHLDANIWTDEKVTILFTAMNRDKNQWISWKEFVDWSWQSSDALTIIRQLQGSSWPPPPPKMLPRQRPSGLNMAVVHNRHRIIKQDTDIGIAEHLNIPGTQMAWEVRRVHLPLEYDRYPGDPMRGIPKGTEAFEYFHIICSDQEVPQYLTRSSRLSLQAELPGSDAHLQWWALLPTRGGYRIKSMSQDVLESMVNEQGSYSVATRTVWSIVDHDGEAFKYDMGRGMKSLLAMMAWQEAEEVKDLDAQKIGTSLL